MVNHIENVEAQTGSEKITRRWTSGNTLLEIIQPNFMLCSRILQINTSWWIFVQGKDE